ncbi:protein OSB4, chloroplastic isoform X2 [Arabidopsis lyrata subsp. lyrata]|uniref:protein OSB4, chloroplastic isoform X2 n=1 Tax=Arabidopsis lyrata subsp. lyrata TaxID=81972 RepID=UPI000A29A315|nr:protein OSB4, chloroplastic isoform X2 [Arabidopsis lyrata subsp. lyrata]|eukprot:XP_020870883.1 protein OSB4, chloroplastic isoform X2 [Arabidopsis lyrata subsp. lyrata]
MQFLARSLSKSIRPSLNSASKQSWVLSHQYLSTFSAESSSRTRGGGSRAEKSTEEWPRPTEVPYQPKIANSIDLIGIPVLFEGDLAHTANSYLKKNDRVHITGQILGDVIQSGANSDQACVQLFKSFHGSFSHQVMVRDLHYIEGSKALPKVMPTVNQNEGVLKHSASVQRGRDVGTNLWFDLVDKPDEWCDYRESKQNGSVNPKHPDFKKKDGSQALWLNKAPTEILSELEDVKFDIPKYAPKPKAGEESWKDLVENMNKWWDNRLDKRHPKAPDFKHKETGVGLWLSDSPSWVLEKLPPPKSKTSDIYGAQEMF